MKSISGDVADCCWTEGEKRQSPRSEHGPKENRTASKEHTFETIYRSKIIVFSTFTNKLYELYMLSIKSLGILYIGRTQSKKKTCGSMNCADVQEGKIYVRWALLVIFSFAR